MSYKAQRNWQCTEEEWLANNIIYGEHMCIRSTDIHHLSEIWKISSIMATYRTDSGCIHIAAGPVGHIANGGVPVEEEAAANEEK